MHEAKLVEDIVRKAIYVAHESGHEEVQQISIEIGALNHATPTSLRELLSDAALGTVLEGASFEIERSLDTKSPTALDIRLVSMTVKGN
ncbi:MAG: hydrogenase/urease maturation nickel metallochaperone HypA [Acidimicrobiia bacterium]